MKQTLRVNAAESYESYCAALGVDVRAARGASVLKSLAAYVADDPIGRATNQSKK